VGTELFELLGEADVVLEVVFGAGGVQDVAGVADGGLAEGPGFEDGFHRDPHVRHPVERIENAEDVHAGGGGLLAELADDIVGIAGVADGVAGAEEHLKEDVGNLCAQVS
jgi:hypothetical protein